MASSVNNWEEEMVEVEMAYAQSPPLVEKEWLTAEGTSSAERARDLQRIGVPPKQPSIQVTPSSSLNQVVTRRPSIGRRILRTLTRFLIAVLIGVAGTLAWQSYGDAAREMAVAYVPTLASLLPVSATTSPAVAAPPSDPMQRLEPFASTLASNLDVVRRNVEQLAAKQEQLTQDIAALQAVDEDIRQKLSSAPPSPPQQAASMPRPKPAQPRAQPSALQPSSVPRPQPVTAPLSPSH
jgi:hypothetical protein